MGKSTNEKLFKEASLLIAKKKNESVMEFAYKGNILILGEMISSILYTISAKSVLHEEVLIAIAKEYLMKKLEERGEL